MTDQPKRGRPILNTPKDKAINFRLDSDTYHKIKDYCAENGLTISKFMETKIFEDFISDYEKQKEGDEEVAEEKIEELYATYHQMGDQLKEVAQSVSKKRYSKKRNTYINTLTQSDMTVSEEASNPKFRLVYYLKVASIVLVGLTLGYTFDVQHIVMDFLIVNTDKEHTTTQKKENDIVLRLSDGRTKVLNNAGGVQRLDDEENVKIKQTDQELQYESSVASDEVIYNELIIPYGKRFRVKLSDGTGVYLNAGSTLKYPISFVEGRERKVYLSGEAYFDVTKKGVKNPFIVDLNGLNIKVLGTSFNVSNYAENSGVETVLVEGSVEIYQDVGADQDELRPVMLKPGEKAAWKKDNRKISIEEVNIELYKKWIDGGMMFKDETFSNICKKMERYFNVSIDNQYPLLDKRVYTAAFRKDIDVEKALNYLSKGSLRFEFMIRNNQITIYKPN